MQLRAGADEGAHKDDPVGTAVGGVWDWAVGGKGWGGVGVGG